VRGVGLMGDKPIYVSHDSADCWAHQELFFLDHEGRPELVAGVPPDYFSRKASCGAIRCTAGTSTSAPASPGGSRA